MENYITSSNLTDSTSTGVDCPHHTGWYFIVKFWVFKKKMYWCELCKTAIEEKKLTPTPTEE